MKFHQILNLHSFKLITPAVVLLSLFIALFAVGLVPGTAQSDNERKFEDLSSEQLPIKIKIKTEKEKAAKDLENKNWARDLELEVKNTGSKPIYYLFVVITMQDVLIQGNPLAFRVVYGRPELVYLTTTIKPDDVPILPGQSITLKVPEQKVKAYEKGRTEEQRADPKKVEFSPQFINFGDGTGLVGPKGKLIPDPARKQSQNLPIPKQGPTVESLAIEARAISSSGKCPTTFQLTQPASFLRANFSPQDYVATASAASPVPCNCQNSNNCMWGYLGFAVCACDDPNQFAAFVPAGFCSNPYGSCFRTDTIVRTCQTRDNGTVYCQFEETTGESCAIGDPTPTPTPSPSATPTPTCDPNTRPNDTNCICAPSTTGDSLSNA